MNILEIITKKRDNQILTNEEIEYFVKGYTEGSIPDYQAASLLMAIYLNGMNEEETTNLTLSMAHSGDVLDLSNLGTVVDKHSTGGVGDKVTLILAPIIASLGVPVAKMSGRGLGFTGGTIDKLEAIPGYETNLSMEQFMQNVQNSKISLIGQTANLAPADKKLYALRDTIGCVENIPLIASSIMSKKIAAGASKIVIDVTCGNGAFMKDLEHAKQLSEMLIKIGKLAGKETVCVITNMEEPLGVSIGNSLEVIEAIQFLKGNMQEDVKDVVLTLGAHMLKLAKKSEDLEKNKQDMLTNIENGKALAKFKELVENQGGDVSYINTPEKFEKAKYILPVKATKSGYISSLPAQTVGEISRNLGAGRFKKEDGIEQNVGIVLAKKVGDEVNKGETIAYIHANSEQKAKQALEDLVQVYQYQSEKVIPLKSILS
ncbi:MAG: pyrimidine-nucleoside phosphorylase [Clostridia bacterium]|nr:pyrimidine-nucleoside phosphorylase [Clostridia bacterium]